MSQTYSQRNEMRQGVSCLNRLKALPLVCGLLALAGPVFAGTLNVTVKDPGGALVSGFGSRKFRSS